MAAVTGIAITMGRTPPPSPRIPNLSQMATKLGYELSEKPTALNVWSMWRFDLLFGTLALLLAAGYLYANGIADAETIDKTWRIGTGAPRGPMEIFDIVGLTTAYNVSVMGDEESQKFAKILKEDFIDKGKLGIATGEGFYNYK